MLSKHANLGWFPVRALTVVSEALTVCGEAVASITFLVLTEVRASCSPYFQLRKRASGGCGSPVTCFGKSWEVDVYRQP